MSNNIDDAFEVDNGIILDESTGLPYITGGLSSPVGLDLPEETLYLQGTNSGFVLWKKYNDNPNSWRIFDSTDIPFDPTLQNFDPTIDTVQKGIDLLKQGGGSGVSGTVVGGSTGNLTAGSFFDNEGAPMNITPFDLSLKNILLRTVTFRNENTVTGTIDIEYWDTVTSAWLVGYTVNVSNSKFATIRGLSVSFPDEPQLRYKTNVAIKNPKLVANFNGDSAT